ncbi:hypothetical protein [Halorubrum lipolyticum]|uniref:hypothetical protein n=1 Tax=Halorubrum lipolyticum TaxID=368624 RepID=UPI0011CA3773|nr:hypothetical protein [Halorubrum lipolyticum]
MDFDPYDPVDPLGQNAPFELQDHSHNLIHPEDLKLASDQVLRRAQEQAAMTSPVNHNMISEELNRRKMTDLQDEPVELSENLDSATEEFLSDSESGSSDTSPSDEDGYVENYIESYVSGYRE